MTTDKIERTPAEERKEKVDRYNELVEKQRALTGVIEEAIHTIVETMKVKEGLAREQDSIHGDTGHGDLLDVE